MTARPGPVKKTHHRRGVAEVHVWRDPAGRFHRTPRGDAAAEKLKTVARRLMGSDRTGPRLRFGAKGTRGWWFIPGGRGPYWVRRQKTATWIGPHYYLPTHWGPVVGPGQINPREGWKWVGQPLSDPEVPPDVWKAAKHDVIHDPKSAAAGPSARRQAFGRRTRSATSKTTVRSRW